MTDIPKAVKSTFVGTVNLMFAATGVGQRQIESAVRAFFGVLEGRTDGELTNPEPMDRVIKRGDAARILGCSPKSVSEYVRLGRLKGVYTSGRGARACGVTESSLRLLLSGKSGAKEVA